MSATYLSRPIFEFPIDWAKSPGKRFSYDLREILLGQAPAKFQPIAQTAVTGLEFELLLEDETVLSAFEAFVDSVKGRLNGFWLATHAEACQYIEPIGAGYREFYIRDQQMRDSFTGHSYLCFQNALSFRGMGEGVRQYGRISNVTLEGGRERVTLEADAAPAAGGSVPPPYDPVAMDATWHVSQLLYVRLADDAVEIAFLGDNRGRVKLKVVELPEEYAAIETGQQPVFLYRFSIQGVGIWDYTNLNVGITANSVAYTPWPIIHDGHRQSLEGGENEMTIQTVYDAASPVAKLFPYPTPKPMFVTINETTYGTPDNITLLFGGFVESASLNGAKAELKCVTQITALGRQFPRFFIQNRCNYSLFSTHCSGSDGPQIAQWRISGTISELGARHVRIGNLTHPTPTGYTEPLVYTAGFFAFGYFEHLQLGTVKAIRTIESNLAESGGIVELVLTAPLNAVEALVGDSVYLYPGCDGTRETCAAKFHNFARWGGHNLISKNLAINAIDIASETGNKK